MKKVSKMSVLLVLAITISFSFGVVWYRNKIFPFKLLSLTRHPNIVIGEHYRDKFVIKYLDRMSLFSNRTYYDSIYDPNFANSYLVAIPRHLWREEKVKIHVTVPVTVYRFLCVDNDNKDFTSYEPVNDISINVIGLSCLHDQLVKKKFDAGNIELSPGGPIATSPIVIKASNKVEEQFLIVSLLNPYRYVFEPFSHGI